MSSADLFVVCKQCGSEVSPYITECPYCGARLRKRAPRLDKPAPERKVRMPSTSLPRLRRGEIPGIRGDRRPAATALLVAGSVGLSMAWRATAINYSDTIVVGRLGNEWWRAITANFTYANLGYQVVALSAIALFGWLLERRYGQGVVVTLFLIGGTLGMLAASATETLPLAAGGNGAALALLCGWLVPAARARRSGEDDESDFLAVAVIALVLLLMPLAVVEADPLVGAIGGLTGLGLGLALSFRAAP